MSRGPSVMDRIRPYVRAIDRRIESFEVTIREVETPSGDPEFFPTLRGAWDKNGEPLLQDIPPRAKEDIADIGYQLVGERASQLRGEWRDRFEDADGHRISIGTVRVEAVYRPPAESEGVA